MGIGAILSQYMMQKNTNCNKLSAEIGVSRNTLYSIINRDNMKVDFEILAKMCDALDISIDELYNAYKSESKDISYSVLLTSHERDVMFAYRANREMQPAVDRLLGVTEDESHPLVHARIAARSAPGEKSEPIREELMTPEEVAEVQSLENIDNL